MGLNVHVLITPHGCLRLTQSNNDPVFAAHVGAVLQPGRTLFLSILLCTTVNIHHVNSSNLAVRKSSVFSEQEAQILNVLQHLVMLLKVERRVANTPGGIKAFLIKY